MSTSNWKAQNEIVRFVEACHRANVAGSPVPSFEQFRAAEAADSVVIRTKRGLRDRSRIHFRKGGELALAGDRTRGALNLAASAALWPPAFGEKLMDQIGSRAPQRDR